MLLVAIVGVPAYELVHHVWPGRSTQGPFSARALTRGELTQAIEQNLERAAELPKTMRPYYNQVLFEAFHVGTPQVLAGEDGWLFLASTVRDYPPRSGRDRLPQVARSMAAFARLLEARGAPLVVLLVPNKASVIPHRVPRTNPPFEPAYDEALAALRQAGLDVVDPRPVLMRDGEPLYFRTDTHWTPEGAVAAARLLRDHLARRFGEDAWPGTRVAGEIVAQGAWPFEGGLLRMLGFPEGLPVHARLMETRNTTRGVHAGTRKALEFTGPEAIVLAGTSFSNGYHLASLMAVLLGRRVEDRGIVGKGPVLPLLEPLQDARLGRRPMPELLLWEIPERFLLLDSDAFQDPLDNLVRAYRYDPAAALELDAGEAVYDDVVVQAVNGSLAARSSSTQASITWSFEPPLPGDGSVALAFELTVPRPTRARVWLDCGDGFDVGQRVDIHVVGFDSAQLMIVPLECEGGRAVARARLQPLTYRGSFRIGPLEAWPRVP